MADPGYYLDPSNAWNSLEQTFFAPNAGQPAMSQNYQNFTGFLEANRSPPTVADSISTAMNLLGPGRAPGRIAPYFAAEKGGAAGSGFLEQLNAAGTNRATFDQVFESLKTSNLPKAELVELASAYSGGLPKPRASIADLQQEIFRAYIRNARFQNKIAP